MNSFIDKISVLILVWTWTIVVVVVSLIIVYKLIPPMECLKKSGLPVKRDPFKYH